MLGEQLCPYPGCKAKLRSQILPILLALGDDVDEFVDVFAGAGGIALAMMFRRPDIRHVVNDLDTTMIALWMAVRDQPDGLIERIRDDVPQHEDFAHARRVLRDVTQLPANQAEILDLGFLKLFKQATAHGGWIRGGLQSDVDRRWSPKWLRSTIRLNSARMRFPQSVEITNRDFVAVVGNTDRRKLLFLDPPYWLVNLAWKNHYYNHEFSAADHARLAEMLKLTPHRWVLTYGDHPRIRDLYRWASITPIGERELLIMRDALNDRRPCSESPWPSCAQ
jgi:DNA adenine methylase